MQYLRKASPRDGSAWSKKRAAMAALRAQACLESGKPRCSKRTVAQGPLRPGRAWRALEGENLEGFERERMAFAGLERDRGP